jgi:aquaporin Z
MATPSSAKATIGQRIAVEAIGTFLITASAIGVDLAYFTQGNVDYASRWLARGLAVAAVIYAFSELSGAHVDPAVTLAFVLRGDFPWKTAVGYICAQFAGAFAAAGIFALAFGTERLRLGASHPGPGVSSGVAASVELVLTFALVLVILMTAREKPVIGAEAAVAVGFTVAACGFAAGWLSGASMNPARSIAPQLLSGQFQNVWIYLAGPVVGAALAVGTQTMLCGFPSKAERRAAKGKEATR